VAAACAALEGSKLPPKLMVDCSHANCAKKYERQMDVAQDIANQLAAGSRQIFGVMVESHIEEGAQKFTPGKDNPRALQFGQSITDPCLGWSDSERLLQVLADAVKTRRLGKH
jgi:3-deoxy-7-phosphoheptulonate synthase